MSCFVASLRIIEAFMLDSAVLRHHIGKGMEGPLDHVVITLIGRFKGKTGIRHHMQAVINGTAPKLIVRWWLERLTNDFIWQG